MHSKQEVVLGFDSQSKPHEKSRIHS